MWLAAGVGDFDSDGCWVGGSDDADYPSGDLAAAVNVQAERLGGVRWQVAGFRGFRFLGVWRCG